VYIQYVGFNAGAGSRTYSFQVIDTPRETRDFTVNVQSEAFRPTRLRLQDGPAICLARLRQELQGETEEARALAHLNIEEGDVQQYLELHRTSLENKRASRREVNGRYEQDSASVESDAMAIAKPQVS
jgi:hypothetical protein